VSTTTIDVAQVLSEIATLAELNGENPFRTRAFANAARALEGTDADLETLAREDRLTELPGVGAGIAEVIRELVETGRSEMHDELRTATPPGLFDLMRIPGLGTKRIHTLHAELGIDSLDALERAVQDGSLAKVKGFGAKSAAKIGEGIAFVNATRGRRRYPAAERTAAQLLDWLRGQAGVKRAEVAGALRRRMEVVDAVDLVVDVAGDAAPLLAGFAALNGVAEVTERDEAAGTVAVRLTDGMPARLRCTSAADFAGALLWETGSEAHLAELAARAEAKGRRLDARGLWKDGKKIEADSEAALYRALGLEYVAPELREGAGEIEAAAKKELPDLVELGDLRGTFHCHTTYSDGKATVAEMAGAARAKGWQYLGLADHSRAAAYAGGLSPERVREQHAEIDAWNREYGEKGKDRFRIFKGIESDILPDGSLDYDDALLASFDYVVGSVHSSFTMSREEMTERVLRAIENPYLTILGHATGRLLLVREGYQIDVDAVIDAAAEHGVAIEINADPHRLDLDWRHVRRAAELGVLIPINPDAHSVAGLDNVAYGVNVARKAWLAAPQVLNTWTLEEVEAYFAGRREKAR
jgi:DNA polymerase (family 10)